MNTHKQILFFIIVGTLSVGIDFSIYNLLTHLYISIDISKAISYLTGLTFGYFANSKITFSNIPHKISKYYLTYFLTFLINILVNKLLNHLTKKIILSWFFATATSSILNFLFLKIKVYRKSEIIL